MKAAFRSLSAKVVGIALLISTLFTLFTTALLIFLHYRAEQSYAIEQLRLAAENTNRSLAVSLWEVDLPAVRLQLDALAHYPGVSQVVLTSAIGQSFTARRNAVELAPGATPASLSVSLQSPEPPSRPIGNLLLIADQTALWERIGGEGLRILAAEAVKGFLIALLLAWLITRLVTRHVTDIARQVSTISPEALDRKVELDRAPTHAPDELDQLCEAFNVRNHDLADYLRRQKAMEEELRVHRDNLARMIDERTSSLLQSQQALRRANQELYELSRNDALTGLANRRHFDEVKAAEFRRAMRASAPLSVLMCDLDDFKAYNDAYGHAQGDVCLKRIGECLAQLFSRAGELPARLGGEEFAVLLPNTTIDQAMAAAERLRQAVQDLGLEHRAARAAQVVTLSIGVASLKQTRHHSFDQLLHDADEALYQSKQAGRNRVTSF